MDQLEKFKNMSVEEANAYLEQFNECTHDCSDCSAQCAEKTKKPAKKVIAVTGGKGGTGKSAMTVLLARALLNRGRKAAILDADIVNSSVAHLLGMREPVLGDAVELAPAVSPDGIAVISMALISADPAEPIIWPGLDLAKLAVYFMQQANWGGDIDVLLVDMPTGAGDVPLEYYTTMPMDMSLVVAVPGEAASGAVLRSINLAEMLLVPVMGIIENFAEEGFELSEKYGDIPVVARLSYDVELRKAADEGRLGAFETTALDYLSGAIDEMI